MAIIDINAYCMTYRLKAAQVIVVSMRDLEYQVEIEVWPKTNPTTNIPIEYHDLFNIFSKED